MASDGQDLDLSERRSLHGLISETYEELSPADRKLADLILNFPAGLPGYTASELAQMASTSNAAVSRFVRRLGFSNFEEMRLRAREEAESGTPVYLLGRAEDAGGADLLERHAATATDNMIRTAAAIDKSAFAAAAERVATARKVWIVGFRHGHPIAAYLRWSLSHARRDVHSLPLAGETFGEHLIDLEPSDVVIVFAIRRRVPAVSHLLRYVAKRGASTIIVADPGMLDVANAAWVLRVYTQTSGPIDDHASALMLAHALTEQVIALLGGEAKSRFAAIDSIHEFLGEL
jgi:DNA-binding MurR/RpiR family transcriptional regulator